MKKKLTSLLKKKWMIVLIISGFILYISSNTQSQWIVHDPKTNVSVTTGFSKANTTLGKQLGELVDANKTLLKTQGYTEEHLKIVKAYAEYLKTPTTELNAAGAGGVNKYSGVYVTYGAVIKTLTNIGFLNNMISYDNGTYIPAQASMAMDVSLFMNAVRTEADNIIAKVTDIKTANKFQMTDGERINLINYYEKEMRLLLGAAQTYIIRAQRVVIGMKSSAKDDNLLFNNL